MNVANLLLARGAARQKEFAIRRALGAAGFRIARQLLTESVLLALAGGAAGLLLAAWSSRMLFHVFKLDRLDLPLRPVDSISMDGRVFAFALLVSCLTGMLFGVAPALSALRGNVNEPLKEGGRTAGTSGRNRLRHVLVASEVALAMVVLCGAGLMIKSVTRLLGVDPGLNPKERAHHGDVGSPGRNLRGTSGSAAFLPGSRGARRRSPGRCVGGRGCSFAFRRKRRPRFPDRRPSAGRPRAMPGANYSVACPNYFRTMGIPILKGREFTRQDTLSAPGVIVINETMARALLASRRTPLAEPSGWAGPMGRV